MKVTSRIAVMVGLTLLGVAGGHAQEQVPQAEATPTVVDPFAALAGNPLLRDVVFLTDRHYEPAVVALQQSGAEPGQHERDEAWVLGAWTRHLMRVFITKYAGPANIAPRAGRELLLVVAVAQPTVFEALRTQAGARDVHDEQAFFAPQLPGVVVLDPGPAASGKAMRQLVRPVLHAVTHALLDACAAPGAPPLPAWLVEGFAERLSAHADQLVDEMDCLRATDRDALMSLSSAFVERRQRVGMLRPLPELLALGTLADLDARVAGMDLTPHDALHGLAHESSLFLAWLDEGDEAHPERATALLRGVLAGQPAAGALATALEGVTPEAVEPVFADWARAQMEHVTGAQLGEFTLQPPPVENGEVRLGVRARPAHLVVPPGDAAFDHALALHLAAEGDLRGAATRLDALRAAPGLPAADVALLKSEGRLCLAVDDLRRRWLAERVGRSIELRDGAATVKVSLVSAQGGQLTVRDKGRQQELPESACLPGALAAQLIAPGTLLPVADDEARAFAWLLATDADWKNKTSPRLRKDSGPAAAAVLDMRAGVEARLELGEALASLADLAVRELPAAGAADAQRDAWLALAQRVAGARALPVVAERLPALRSLAGQVLAARFDDAPLRCSPPRAKLEELPGGRVRATWDFSDPLQLQDWVSVPMRPEDIANTKAPRFVPEPAGLTVAAGALEMRGTGRWRCKLGFAAPLTIDYDAIYANSAEEQAAVDRGEQVQDSHLVQNFGLRLCAGEASGYLLCFSFGNLYALDVAKGASKSSDSTLPSIFMAVPYHLRLEHDGQRLQALVDAAQVAAVPVLGRTTGMLELWHHTERTVQLRQLVVEGALDPVVLHPVRDAWVVERLAALGAGP